MKNSALSLLTRARLKNFFAVFMTLCSVCLLPSAQGSVTIDQNPLTSQSPVAPNIALLLDDSGSMAWNFMPDLCSGAAANLSGVTCNSSGDINTQPNNDALTNSNNNGVYYNPAVTYTAPIKVDGTSFPNSPSLTGAYADGFTNTATTVNVTTYASTSTYSSSNFYYTGAAYETEFNNVGSGKSNVAFSIPTTAISATCTSGYSVTNLGSYTSPNYQCALYGTQTPTCSSGTYNSTNGTCVVVPPTPSCPTGYTLTGSGSSRTCSGTQTANPTCPSSGVYGTSTGLCTLAVVSCATSYGTGYALTNTGTSAAPNYQCLKTATPACATGYTFSSTTGACTATPPTPTCSSGFSIANLGTSAAPNYQCQKIVTPTCTAGYTFSSTTGACTATPPTPTCSTSGTSLSKPTGASAFNCNSTPSCSSGSYTASSGTCAVTPPLATCPSGTSMSKVSGTSTFNCNSTPTCSSGTYDASTGTCTVTPPLPTCSTSGTSLSQPTGATAYNCNSTPTCTSGGVYNNTTDSCSKGTRTCPSGTNRNKFSGASIYTCNATASPNCSSGTFAAATGTCTVAPPAPTCPGGTSISKLSGASIFTCNATPSCSTGTFTPASGLCAVTPPTPTCLSGTSLGQFSGATVFTCNASAAPNCSLGSFTASSGTCTVTPIPPTCSSGSLANTGTSTSPNFQCQSTAAPACSLGTYNSSTNVCTLSPPTPTCTSPLTLTGTGASTTCASSQIPKCNPTTYGYDAVGGMCTFTPISCPSGYTGSGNPLVCSKPVTATPTCSSGTYSSSTGLCVVTPPTPTCSTSGYSLTNTGTSSAPVYQCAGYTTATATCSSGTFSSTLGQCSGTGTIPTKNFFQFSRGPAAGPYVTYYVASAAQGCVNPPHSSSNCVDENDTSGVAAPSGVAAGQNIANWFSYYHTRILTAKSGLTAAFDKLDPSTRLGYASINGNNNTAIPTSGSYTNSSVKVAGVVAFDRTCVTSTSPCAKGQSGTQRANFWAWVIGESVTGGTALRTALNTLGMYYTQDGPWQNSSTDTTKLACRQSYAIATTDGFWNDPTPPSPGNADNTTASQINGPNSQYYIYSAVAPFKDSTSNTLADVAMKYWSTDLQTSLDNEVPVSTADPAFWQHMTTFTLGLGFLPTNITPAGTSIDTIFTWANGADSSIGTVANSNIPANFAWPTPASNSINNIADLAHAAVNGHGGFYSATSPQAFSAGISDAINRVQTRVGSGASLAANSTKLGVGTTTYQAIYYTQKWTGDIRAYTVDPSSGAVGTSPTWQASAAMPAFADRNIMTYNPSGTTSSTKYVAFSAPSSLSTAEQTALGSTATARQNMINYLRGDSSLDSDNPGGTYRKRSTPLGDIINSQPIYVGSPNPNLFYGRTFSGTDSYAAFAVTQGSRNSVIWVSANDGMLHAFQTSNGAEVFAYLPGAVITNNLSNLSSVNYGTTSVPHQLFNDGELTVADVYTTLPSGTAAAWRTVLVGSTGRGAAKAVYALDVTDPTSPIFLWERSAADGLTNSGYIGQMSGPPVIAQTAYGTWSVLIGNGYNSTQNKAALLQFDLMSGSLSVHTTDSTTDNGLASPMVWINNLTNSISTTAYAGDLKGRVWSFVINDDSTSPSVSTPTSTGSVIFTTSDGTKAQPITAAILGGRDPDTGNLWLFFGTGEYLSQADLSNRDVQTWYGIIVKSTTASLVSNLASWSGSRTAGSSNALTPRSITYQQDATSTTLAARTITVATNGDMIGKSGWFIDLLKPSSAAQGERMVTSNQFQAGYLLGVSRVPLVSDPCNPSGSGWIMAINPFTGSNPTSVYFDINGDQKFTSADTMNGGIPAAGIGFGSIANNPTYIGNIMEVSLDNGNIVRDPTNPNNGPLTRLSWRELITH